MTSAEQAAWNEGFKHAQWRAKHCAAPVAQQAEPIPRGRRTRAEFVKLARIIAEGCGQQDDAPSYLPRTPEAAATFEPHGWVVLALMQAHADGYDDGHADGMAFVKAAHPQQPAPQPLTDAQVIELRARHGWAKETIRAIEAAILRGIVPAPTTDTTQSQPQR